MISVLIILTTFGFIIIKPKIIPYLAITYVFITGLAPRSFIKDFKLALGTTNIWPLDFLYVGAVIFSIFFFLKKITRNNNKFTSSTNITIYIVFILALFFTGKAINGFLDNLPIETIVRLYARDTQLFYFFLPLVTFNKTEDFNKLLIYTVFLCMIFPLFQPLLINSEETKLIMKYQGTFRLGFGDANILLALGTIALFCWEKKLYLAFIPLSGIFMLAHRSAFIGIAASLIAQGLLRGKKTKTLLIFGITGCLVIIMLLALNTLTKVNILDKTIDRAGETFQATKTTVGRFGVIYIALEELEKRPLTGLSYKDTYSLQKNSNVEGIEGGFNRAFSILHPHNFVLAAIMETGILGTSLLFIIILRSLLWSYKLSTSKINNQIGSYLFSSILFFVIFSIMNTTMQTVGYVFWFLVGSTFWFVNNFKLTERKI
ncbi:O-antigen ligase [Methylicorpusculum sp.]|uniref:O-antigen ligase family protein n=1 Tax=Methylicorpusculum sp. TaxID=2713644 RepID=UPI0027283893|nr:O-antigen ligase family protein [Methylicorpusculum sp.]MDO8846600.1 O-antigen ligase family protein [Methylicorpusculum sp.]